ncbi:MAG: hypothetical protein Q9160_002220 [Pyrenula sp. 1 TL-2023]
MLYIDQPVQVGFSYDTPTNVTVNNGHGDGYLGNRITVTDFSDGIPKQNSTFFVGTMASQNASHTANTTHHAAVALWHFVQTWFEEFPKYKPETERISLWTESYGGKYGPAFVSFFQHQNDLIRNGTIAEPGVHYLHLDTLGIVNGCIDMLHQHRFYTDFMWNNTYGLKVINESAYNHAMDEITKKGGVEDRVRECRQLARELDPDQRGNVEEVNSLCVKVEELGSRFSEDLFAESGKYGRFDVTVRSGHKWSAGFVPVVRALGVPVNFTFGSNTVAHAFEATGDFVKGGLLSSLTYLLESGVKVAFVYGDRDWACNPYPADSSKSDWKGGEASSLAIPHPLVSSFSEAGYAPIALSPFRSAGLVRQLGPLLSFSRVYQAGHMVPSYQPEAAYEIFMRAMTNRDVATGQIELGKGTEQGRKEYRTDGPKSAWRGVDSDVLDRAEQEECYVLMPDSTCSAETWKGVKEGRKVIKDWIVVGDVDDGEQETALAGGAETKAGQAVLGNHGMW